MTPLEALISGLEVLGVRAPSGYTWLGERFDLAPGDPAGAGAGDVLHAALGARLYASLYITGGPAPARDALRTEPPRPEPRGALWDANAGRGSREGGWRVRALEGPLIVVERRGLAVWARPGEVVTDDGARPRPGGVVAVLMPKGSPGLSYGFTFADGDAGCGVDDGPVDRFYWNIRAEGRVTLMSSVTMVLNRDGIPFRFKVVNDPEEVRCDAAVLYTPRTLRQPVRGALPEVFSRAAPFLRPRTPLMAKLLAPGLGFAEDPPGDDSFGGHRCGLLAAAVVDAWRGGPPDRAALAGAVADRFAAAGLSASDPHLDAGSDPAHDPAPLAW